MDAKAQILIIDDDPFICDLLDVYLSSAGYTTQKAEDAIEGGKVLLRNPFDLVICDINMPFMSGIELGSLLRTTPKTASIPIIFVSSIVDTETILTAEQLGAAAYLTKPIVIERLLDTVERCLHQSRGVSADRDRTSRAAPGDSGGTAVLRNAWLPVVLEDDVFELTPKGQKELGAAGTMLSPSELKLLVLIDGKSTVGETVARRAVLALESDAVLYLLRMLAEYGFVELVKNTGGSLDFVDLFTGEKPSSPSPAATLEAQKASQATTLLLQQQGYVVRIVRRPLTKTEPEKTRTLSILVVEDEPSLASLLKHVLEAEGFSVRNAENRADITAAFRRAPIPDLVLLDVMLPDVDGFDVLLKIRQHAVLQGLPVMMLTAQATREAVLKGLARGANGYITKPFEIPVLVTAVKTVLGLTVDGSS